MKKRMMIGFTAIVLTWVAAVVPGLAHELLTGPTGTIFHDKNQAYQGYSLYMPEGGYNTFLIDMEGRVVHTWPAVGNPMLTEEGELFGIYGLRHDYGDLVLMDWNGNVKMIWEAPVIECSDGVRRMTVFHHDWKIIKGSPRVPAGERSVIAIARVVRMGEEVEAAGFSASPGGFGSVTLTDPETGEETQTCDTDAIIEFDMDGNVIWVWEFWDHMFHTSTPGTSHYIDITLEEDMEINSNPLNRIHFKKQKYESVSGDTTHGNSVCYNPVRQEVLINPVKKSDFYVIDFNTTIEEAAGEKGDFIYRWGNPSEWDSRAVDAGVVTFTSGGGKKGGATVTTSYGKHDSMIGGSHDVQWIPEGYPGEGNFLIMANSGTPYIDGGSALVEVNPYTDDAFLNPETNWKIDPYVPQDFGTSSESPYSLRSSATPGGPRKGQPAFSKQIEMYFTPQYAFGQYEKQGFFSGHISGVQRLPNGNTVGCSGEPGHFFEITHPKFEDSELGLDLLLSGAFDEEDVFLTNMLCRTSEVVWEFVNPYALPRDHITRMYEVLGEARGEEYEPIGEFYEHRPAGVDGQVFRVLRYGNDFKGFKGKTLATLGYLNKPDEWEDKITGDYSWMFGVIGGSGGMAGGVRGGIGGGAGY